LTLRARLQQAGSTHTEAGMGPSVLTRSSSVRIFSQDESRLGLLPIRRRRLTARGGQPVGRTYSAFESYSLYGAVAPTTGERFFLAFPYLDAQGFQGFLPHFAHHSAHSLNVLVLDNGSFHAARCLQIPTNVVLVPLPPYSPELNPSERLWRDLKDRLSHGVCRKLPALRGRVTRLLHSYSPQMLRSLTGYPYFVNAVKGLIL